MQETTHLIMVSYFRPNDLKKCVESVLSTTKEPYHLSIIDNSCGKIDDTLSSFSDPHITIYRNSTNLGKGRAFMKWYPFIMKDSKADHFISIDSDLLLQPEWLMKMQTAAARVRASYSLGILAPAIKNDPKESFALQIARGRLVMHRGSEDSKFIHHNIFRNRYTAGPLFLIDRHFFESIGGYVQTQLYGNDDGELCKAAHNHSRFIGIVSDVEVLHLKADADDGYNEWKRRNVRKDVDGRGYWD